MSDNHFLSKVEAVRQRITELRQRAVDRIGQSGGVSPRAFDPLLTMLQEMQVAAEELCRQKEELSGTLRTMETERQRYRDLFEFAPDSTVLVDEVGRIVDVNRQTESMFGYTREELLGEPLEILVPEYFREQHPESRSSYYAEPHRRSMGIDVELYGRHKDGHEIPINVMLSPLQTQNGLLVISAIRDITGEKQLMAENARLLETEREQREVAETLREVAGVLNSSLDQEQVQRRILEQLARVIDYDSSSVMLISGDTLDLVAYRSSRFEDREFTPLRIDALKHVQEILENRVPIIIPDTTADPRWLSLGAGEHTRCWLGVPLVVQDQAIGLLNLGKRQPNFYTERDADLAVAFANQAAIAIENARLFDQVRAGRERLQTLSRQLIDVQETERRRIARELHDEVGQILTGLKLSLETIRRLPPDIGRDRLGAAQELVNELMARVRKLSLDLRPSMLDDAGLVPTLLWHFERYTDQTGVVVNFEHNGPERRYPPEVETAAYRIVQEALTNVARHANVNEATVCLLADEEVLSLHIADRGAGFDPDTALTTGSSLGLLGIYERAVLLGGQLVVESAPGMGTRVTAELPLCNPVERGRVG